MSRTLSAEALLAAAIAGAFSFGCGGDDPTKPGPHKHDECPTIPTDTDTDTETPTGDTGTGTGGPVVLSTEENLTITFVEFQQMCTDRGGKLQTHATCAGNNFCAGFHFNKFSKMFMEHTCKALNTCGGVSCVVLPEDLGRTGEEVYNNTCGPACHGGTDTFTLWIHPDSTEEATRAKYDSHDLNYFVTMLAFGSRGMNENGTAFANVAHRNETHSVAELERVMAHIETLPMVPEVFTIVGITEDLN